MSSTRPATHAGSWYSSNKTTLKSFFRDHIKQNSPEEKKARVIVSPHAGYTYCGKILGKAYSKLAIDGNTETVFVLGPSHHVYFQNKALVSAYHAVETPLGNISVDKETIKQLKHSYPKIVEVMDEDTDDEEHSLEMQFSAIKYLFDLHSNTKAEIVPLLISHNTTSIDYDLGDMLKHQLDNNKNCVFVISSDFCHWGARFRYLAYVPDNTNLWEHFENELEIPILNKTTEKSLKTPIYKSIEFLDKGAMEILNTNSGSEAYHQFKKYLEVTGNTICGANPLSVVLAALRHGNCTFHWCGYAQSSHCHSIKDSSVSYGAGYCTV